MVGKRNPAIGSGDGGYDRIPSVAPLQAGWNLPPKAHTRRIFCAGSCVQITCRDCLVIVKLSSTENMSPRIRSISGMVCSLVL
jgi:hypothetical protein